MMKLNRILAGLCLAVCLSGVANAATLLPNGQQQFLSANGAPLAGGTVAFYIPNTSTPKDTWRDAAQTQLNPNPVTLDAAGRATIYGRGAYRQVVKDAAGNLIWDQLSSDTSSGSTSWAGVSTGSPNAQAVNAANFTKADGQSVVFIAGFTNTGALTVNPSGLGAISVVNDTPTGSVTLSGGEVVAGNVVTLVYSGTGGVFHTSVTTSSIPTGVIQEFAGNTPPAGFLLCYGQAVSRATYARLFSVVGTSFGAGDGSSTFNLPDRRGRTAVGLDNMGGAASGRLSSITAFNAVGGVGGEQTHTLTIPELPVTSPSGTVSVTFPAITYNQAAVTPGNTWGGSGVSYNLAQNPATAYAGGTAAFPLNITPYGSGVAHNVVQPSIAMNFIIKY